ncbi:hypothetical protein [Halalkalibacter oceani]|uniref:hypothetical protein n=1 Tax=Halalkalibacter oceani TaxID=1653776 RepID=UPI003397DA3A
MDQAIRLNITGIKCDTKDCDYNDDSVKVEEYSEWLNKPCPKCGGNLLTQDDYDNVRMMINLTNVLNAVLPTPTEDEEFFNIKVDMNGTGKIDMKIEKE